MWISDTSIRRPVFATMAIVSFMVLGIVSLTRLGIDLFPDVTFPFVAVNTVYPGASPQEVETQVSRPLEDAVAAINGVKRVESHSTESFSTVMIEFNLGVDAQAAAAEVREKVAAARFNLPKEIESPAISRFDVSALPIMTFAVGSSLPPDVTRRTVEDDLKPQLEQIEGVAAVDVKGGQVREIHVDLDPNRLEALRLPVSVVAEAIGAENLDVPGGKVTRNGQDVALRTKGEFTKLGELSDVILRSINGSPVRVKDVGEVSDGFVDRKDTTRLNGVDAVSFSIRKQAGGNTVEIAHRVQARLEKIKGQFPAFTINPVHDDAEFIRSNVSDVRFNIIFGGVMAVLIIFVFMRDWRSTLISALALPTSVIATFFFMWAIGFTVNMVTLMALSLVIGILIDDAVVVRENIYRHMEHGEDAMTAAHRGTSEIGLAVMATTFSILAVFLPVGFMGGVVGQFFKEFALTVAFAVAMSLLVAFTLDPMLSSRFVRYIPREERRPTRGGRLLDRWGQAYEGVDRVYRRVLRIAIAHPYRTLAAAGVVFVASMGSAAFVATEFMPVEDRGQFDVAVDLAPGTSFDESVRTIAGIEKQVLAVPEVRQVFTEVGVEGETRKSVLRVKTSRKDQRQRGLGQIKEDLRTQLAGVPFADIRVMNPPFMQGVPNEAPIQVFVRGDDLKELERVSDDLVRRARQVPGARDVSSTLVSGQPEMVARINRAMAADMGFSLGAVAMQLRGMVEGVVASKYRDADKQYDIRLRLAPQHRNDFGAIARAPLYSPTGSAIRTGDIVTMEPGVGPARIQREQRRRQARISIDITGRALGEVTADVRKVIAEMKVPGTFEIGFQGDVDLMQETMQNIGLALLLAVAFIYIVLASQFESFLEPLIIMLSLPLAIVGAILLLLVAGQHLGLPAMIGIVMLMGLVTKNAILLVDYTNQLRRKDGLPLEEALLMAGPVRLRPILMTTMAMILGMLPAAFGLGEGGEFRAPMSLATIGGLITSTALTLVLVPVAYLLTGRLTEKIKSWRGAPAPVAARAVRVTGILLILGLLGAGLAASRAYAGPASSPRPPSAAQAAARSVAEGQDHAMVLTFDAALKYALEHNEGLKVGRERVAESRSRVAEARSGFLPQVDLNVLYTPAQEFPAIRIPAGIFGPNDLSFSAAFTRENVMRFDLTQPLYTGGRLREAYRIRTAQMGESRMQQEREEQTLKLQVVQAFYAALLSEQGRQVAEEGVRLAENHSALAKARFEAGTAARLDVLQTEVELANARARLIRAKASVEVAYQALRTVLSLPSGARVRLEGQLNAADTVPSRAELRAAVAVRPDVRAIGAQKEVAERSMAIATAEMKPSAVLMGNLQYQQDGFSSIFQDRNRSFQFGLALRVPLFAAPAAAARRGVAAAQAKQAEHGRQATLQAGALEVESACAELEAAREIVATQKKALEMAREGLSIAEVSYESGVITASELNDAKVALLTTEWELAQAEYGRIVAAAKARHAGGII